MSGVKLFAGDCLELMKEIPDGSAVKSPVFFALFFAFSGGNLPLLNTKKQGIELPSKGIKGLSNQELNAHFNPKNNRKKRRKRQKK